MYKPDAGGTPTGEQCGRCGKPLTDKSPLTGLCTKCETEEINS